MTQRNVLSFGAEITNVNIGTISGKIKYIYKFPLKSYHFNQFPFKITDNIPFVTNPAGGEIIATTFRRTQLPNGGFTISRAPLDSGEKVT